MNLSSEMQGMFVCDALNRLSFPSDIAEGISKGCCPKCCYPCSALQELWMNDELDLMVMQAPESLWKDVAWWDKEKQRVDPHWLFSNWGCQSIPPCEEDDVSSTSN